jgi:hypothetical protein
VPVMTRGFGLTEATVWDSNSLERR